MASVAEQLGQALELHRAGELAAAGEIYREILRKDPKNADALNLLGVALHQVRDLETAESLLSRAASYAPDFAPVHVNLGNVLQDAGKLEDAVAAFERALKLQPNLAEAASNLSNALNELGRPEEAEAAAQRAVAANPTLAPALNNLGNALMKQGKAREAAEHFRSAVQLAPDDAKLRRNLGSALLEAGDAEGATAALGAALQLLPTDAAARYNLGNAYLALDRIEDAVLEYQTALRHKPDYVDARCTLGAAELALGRPQASAHTLRTAIADDPKNPDAHWNLALALLQQGDYAEGWREYEWRSQVAEFERFRRCFDIPAWDGGSLVGKRLLVHAEQGFGDAIRMVRYMPLLAERGAHVIVECRPQLTRLFKDVAGVAEIVDLGQPLPPADLYVPLMSLPFRMGTRLETVPADMPYLRAPPDAPLDNRIEGAAGLKIGLVWAGSPTRRESHRRTMDKELLAPLLDLAGVSFFSLQLGAKEILAGIVDVTDGISDFADTAGLIAGLDLVIAVDTAVLHLAAAMGKPALGLMSRPTGFLWGTDGETSAWYPTLRLFRQPERGDWESVVRAVRAALETLISSRRT